MATSLGTFTGFRREAIQFLADLAINNDRSWFQPRKADYERLLKEPLEALCVALSQRFAAHGIPLAADPARSPFRIYRDVRFSRDKSPYKTNVGAGFPWTEGQVPGDGARHGGAEGRSGAEGRGRAGGYFHFQPGEIFVGGGMWHPEPSRLAAWRTLVAGDPARVHAAISDPAFVAEFGAISGEQLKRVPAGYPPDHAEAELLRLKDVVFGRSLSDAEALSAELPDILATALEAGVPVLRLLATLPA